MTTRTNERVFRVEGHGDGVLMMIGGVTTALSPFRPEPLLTRAGAWSSARRLMRESRATTVKVFRDGRLVWRACRLESGAWCDMATGLPIPAEAA